MLVILSRLVSKHDFVWPSVDSVCRKRLICLPLLLLGVAPFQSAVAQQSDVSVLVSEGYPITAASVGQVELPRASGSRLSFDQPPVSSRPFAPPLPPASMLADSDRTASFRSPIRRTLTAAVAPGAEEQPSLLAKSAASEPTISAVRGTFASGPPSSSSLQTNNSFGRSPAESDVRFGDASSSSTRNRFGSFGVSPAPKTENRFAPASSFGKAAPSPVSVAPPSRPEPTSSRFKSPAIVPPAAPQVSAATAQNRFRGPTPPAVSNRFASVSPPVAKPPQATAQSLLAPNNSPRPSSSFPAAPSRFTNPAANSSIAIGPMPSSRGATGAGEQSAFGASGPRSFGGTGLRTASTRVASNSKSDSPPMIRRQSGSSSQSSFENSRPSAQSGQFGNQSQQRPLRGRPIENDLRGGGPSGQAPANQRATNANRSNGKVDRQSIDFAQQQLRDIQAVSTDVGGTPVRLVEMFSEPLSGSQRKQMVAQYWETYYDMAALKIATDYEKWLNSISTSTGTEKGLLTAAQQMAADGQLAAEIQLGKSQSRLLDFMPNPRAKGFAPLPADEPLVERYVTDYEKYKRVRSLPTGLRGIDPMLASTLKLITRRAATASMAKKAADQSGQAVGNRQAPLASAIAVGQIWRDSQLDMVASTVSYNQAISDFVLTLEPNRSPEQLTAFMLGASKAGPQSSVSSLGGQSGSQSARNANQQPLGQSPNRQTQYR